MLLVTATIFGLTFWFGLYLLNRDWHSKPLRYAGLGLSSYAAALALYTIDAAGDSQWWITALVAFGPFVPLACWIRTVVALFPVEIERSPVTRVLLFGVVPATIALGMAGSLLKNWQLSLAAAVVGLLGIVLAFVVLWRHAQPLGLARAWPLIAAATMFFTLATALLLFPLALLPAPWMLLAIGGDLVVLGIAIVRLDAFQQGEKLVPDFVRSLDSALLAALLLGSQAALVIVFATGATTAIVALLFGVLAAAIALSVFANTVQRAIDSFVLARFPDIQ